jgi:hypothetical protein
MKKPIKTTLLILILLSAGLSMLPAQSWVSSYGMDTVYKPPRYLSGYGFSDLPDRSGRMEAARSAAMSQLSRQVRVQITSREAISTLDSGSGVRERYTSNIQTASDLVLSGVQFEIAEQRRETHVLAWVEISALRRQYENEAADARGRISAFLAGFDRDYQAGRLTEAEEKLLQADVAMSALTDTLAVIRALDILAGPLASGFSRVEGNDAMLEVHDRRSRLSEYAPSNPRDAARFLARTLAGTIPGDFRIMPLLYRDADFSSTFGSSFAGMVESELAALPEKAGEAVVIRGSYWPEDEGVEVRLTARSAATGRVVAAAHTTIPAGSLDAASLTPANLDTALAGGRALLDDRIVHGGLDVEVWTDRGRNESALVFQEEEPIQFYFRVNQPAFLQLSYVLSSGQTVLLEEEFYIGMDRVNRVVALPYRFVVVPPFGVERLIVTAHSGRPPRQDVRPMQISGQWYDVFAGPEAAVGRTRGLAREQASEGASGSGAAVRVGEASLSITTMARPAD